MLIISVIDILRSERFILPSTMQGYITSCIFFFSIEPYFTPQMMSETHF